MPKKARPVQPITSDFIYELPGIADPAIHPDGQSVAYVAAGTERGAASGHSHIEVVSIRGGEALKLTAGPGDRAPQWSPDGRTLAFLRKAVGEKSTQVWVIPGDGGEARAVSKLPLGVLGFNWSPDGTRVVAFGDVAPQPPPDPERPRAIEVKNIYYRGDTLGYRYELRRHVFVIEIADGSHRAITHGDYEHFHPCFSPDGKRIAFASTRSPKRHERLPLGAELCVVATTGGAVQRLTPDVAGVAGFQWSPDGTEIACVISELDEAWQSYLWLVNPKNGDRQRLSTDRVYPQTGFFPVLAPPTPVWIDDEIVLPVDARASSQIVAFDREGRMRTLRNKTETIAGFSVASATGTMALVASDPGRPPAVFTQSIRSKATRAIAAPADAWVDSHPPGKVERFTVRRGGVRVDCGLMLPHGYKKGQRYPLVLEIHGGPNSYFAQAFNPLHQIIAGAGFMVLFVNPRGSTTYGTDFAGRVQRDWGGEDFLDLMAAVDAACERDDVDPSRLGVHGYSYGGYMTSWIVGRDHRFKAAIVGAPVTNLWSMYGQTDIGVPWGKKQFGGRPSDNLEWYVERSPLSWADKVKTPVLLLHGEADYRCPISQSEELFVALAERGKKVEFVRFPDCSHLFLRVGHPALKQEYYNRVVEWFRCYLVSGREKSRR